MSSIVGLDGRVEAPRLDEARGTAWRKFTAAYAAVSERIERGLVEEGLLSLGCCDVLVALAEAPERRLRMSELARTVALSRSGLTRMVDRLERAGLLCRKSCPTDRRGSFAVLTERGLATLRESWPVYARGIAGHFGRHLDDREVRVLAEAFDRLAEASGSPDLPFKAFR